MKPFNVLAYLEFKRIVEKIKPDILHAHNWRATTFALWLKSSLRIPVVVHEHIVSPHIPFVQQLADRALNHRVDRVLAVSEAVASSCRHIRHFPREQIEILVNGIPLGSGTSYTEEQAAAVKLELGIEPEFEVIGFVGRLGEQKGPFYLIEAFSILLRNCPRKAFLVMIGDGPLVDQSKELSQKLGIEERVSFLGYRRDVSRLQAAFTLQVMPSLWEGLGLVALEAMAAGIPLVASNIPGPDEFLRNDVNSVLVPPKDTEALAEALGSLLMDPQRRERFVKAAHESVRSYDIDLNVAKMLDVYTALLGHKNNQTAGE
jgi:glycosyltransferase involved in cell wall biosynthesis